MNPAFTADERDYMRSRYSARDVVIFDPCTPVFRAKVASLPTGPTYLQLAYNTVSLGDYTDIREGMEVVISATADHTQPLWTGRMAANASASLLPINESAFVVTTAYYITVIDTYNPLPMVRAGDLVDGRKPYQGQAATITNLPSVLLKASAGTAQFILNPSIIPVDGATVTGIVYDIPGAVYDMGSSTTLNSTITMPADSHTWARLTYTLSTGVIRYMVFQIIVYHPTASTLTNQAIDSLRLTRTWEGQHATCRAFRGVGLSAVMNGTRCVVASRTLLRGGDVDLDPVLFVGYLIKETNATQNASDKNVAFEIASLWERAASLPLNPIAIRDVASPSQWDEINLPTTQRVINHILARYSTLLTLCALNLDYTDSTWYGGDMDVNSSSIGDAVKGVLSEIQAQITAKPSGELFVRRDLRDEDDATRDAAAVMWTLERADIANLQVTVNHNEQTGRVVIGVAGYNTSRSAPLIRRVAAPAVTLGSSPETQTLQNQLLPANKTPAELFGDPLTPLVEGLGQKRAGNILAMLNPPHSPTGEGRPSLSMLSPNCFEWIDCNIPASAITRGWAVVGRYLLASMEIEYDSTLSSHRVNFELLPETQGGAAMTVVSVPSTGEGFVTPPQSAYSGNYPTPSTLNGDNPTFTRGDMGGMGNPYPADQSNEEAALNGGASCTSFAISFANSSPVGAGFTSVLGANYEVTLAGKGIVQDISQCSDFTAGRDGWGVVDNYVPGEGFMRDDYRGRPDRLLTTKSVGHILSATIIFNEAFSTGWIDLRAMPSGSPTYERIDATGASSYTFVGDYASGINLDIGTDGVGGGPNPDLSPTLRLIGICYTVSTENRVYSDAFYTFRISEEEGHEGEEIDIAYTDAFTINGVPIIAPPLYNPSHQYTVQWEGDGNIPSVVYNDDDYLDNSNDLMTVKLCGENAAT